MAHLHVTYVKAFCSTVKDDCRNDCHSNFLVGDQCPVCGGNTRARSQSDKTTQPCIDKNCDKLACNRYSPWKLASGEVQQKHTREQRPWLTKAEQQLARGQVHDLQHSLSVLLMLLQQRRLSNVKDPDSALVKATGQLVAVWVIAAALDDLPRRCQLKQLCMSGGIPTTNCSIRGHCAVLAPAGIAKPTWHLEVDDDWPIIQDKPS